MEQIRLSGESRELREEIVELGTRYGIVTPYTSYLVLEPGAQERNSSPGFGGAGTANRIIVQGATEAVRSHAAPATNAVGETAVKDSKQKAELREAEKIAPPKTLDSSTIPIRTIAGKTIYL